MKKILYLSLVINLLICSCSENDNEDSLVEETLEDGESTITATETCLISDFFIQQNSTIIIDCLLDLEGETINIPSGVTFVFEGGDIFNGILNFSSEGAIDGELLNSNLSLEGDVQLTNEEFEFVPSRWDIVEVDNPENPQPPSLEIAYNNHLIIQSTVDLVKRLGASTFTIDRLNAFFDSMNGGVDAFSIANPVILVPSDFHLKMSDNTYLRVLPVSGIASSVLIRIFEGSNIEVSGGNLIGDRLEHGPVLGQGILFRIAGGKNIMVDGIDISLSSSTGLTIHSSSFRERPDYFGSENITVQNCVFDSNRANNLSLTDGQDIIIQNNRSYNAGIELEGDFGISPGIAPRIGIIVETQVMQFVENVIIRNNTVENSGSPEGHDILAVGATDIEITANTAERSVGWSSALNVHVTDNTSGRIFGGFLGFEGVDNIVSGNTVTNPDGAGIFLTDQNVEVFDNNLINCRTAIQLSSFINGDIHNNRITSNVEGAVGILGQNYLDNVTVYDNDIDLEEGRPFNIIAINTEPEEEDYQFEIIENRITASRNGLMPGSSNITISDNMFAGAGIGVSNASNIVITNNVVINEEDFATLEVSNGSNHIEIIGNTFEGTNDGPFGTAVRISNSVNSNINFHNNSVKSIGINFGMDVNDIDGISIRDNTIENESTFRSPLHFIGDDSEIINNTLINSNGFEGLTIEGSNNIVSGNN